jgi:hypothetical protein
MPTEIYPADDILATGFQFDADLQSTNVLPFQVTSRKVESRGNIAEHIASLPETHNVTGMVTAMNMPPAVPDPEKLANSKKKLKELAAKRQIVIVLSDSYDGELAISRVEITDGADMGRAFKATLGFTLIETTTVGTAEVPASRLRSKVKRKAAPAKKGGAAKGSQPTPKARTGLAYVIDKAKGLLTR